jgi:hypothetical protein
LGNIIARLAERIDARQFKPFRRPSPGSFSARSGSTAPRTASMFATATGLMMLGVAATWTAGVRLMCDRVVLRKAVES